ncbi:MAG: IS110 family transposase [Thermoplasmata archaeon]
MRSDRPSKSHVQEYVETRARVRKPKKEVKQAVNPERKTPPVPNYMRPCLSLDVHKRSITATRMDPGGQHVGTWTLPTTRSEIVSLAQSIPESVPVVLEASTAGKAVALVLKEAGCELHMAAPNKIPKPEVKTDKRDSIRLAQLYQSGSMPECYVPPPEIEHLRLLTRNRRDLAAKVTLVKNQVHALVTRNLADSDMKGVSDWYGAKGLRQMIRLSLPAEDQAHLARYLEQLELLAHQEESMQAELAQVARDHPEISLLMTIPGVNFYTAVGIVAEIGDIRRFQDKQHLASYAGLVPKADDSGDTKGQQHRPVKKGNMVLKSFLCTAVKGMLKANQKTAVTEFYRKKVRTLPAQKVQVAAARKLSAEVWKILTFGVPYREEDADLTERKEQRMRRIAETSAPEITTEQLEQLADRLSGKAELLDRLQEEAGGDGVEVQNAG